MNGETEEGVDAGGPSDKFDCYSESGVCWVCREGQRSEDGDNQPPSRGGPLLQTGCACRGSSGLAHLSCLVQAAAHDVAVWTTCPTCRQEFTGECEVGLARARWEGVKGRPAADGERLHAANNLAVTLQQSTDDAAGARRLLEEVLAVRRRTRGNEDQDTLDSVTNLALHHSEAGNYALALALSEEALATTRRTVGTEHMEAGHAIISLAAVHALMRRHDLALPLHEEALGLRRRLLGPDHLDTMNSASKVGQCLVCLGEEEKGMAMLEETVATARRVLGTAHPSFEHFESCRDVPRGRGPAGEASGMC